MSPTAYKYTWEESVKWLLVNEPEIARSCYYDDPIDRAAERFSLSEEWLAVQKLLQGKIPCAVLDIGAGRGISSYAFAKLGCEVYALEPDPSAFVGQGCIAELGNRSKLKITIVSDLSEFNEESPKFDIVYCRASLHHIPNLDSFFRKISGLLRKGGIFFASREHIILNDSDKDIFLKHHDLHKLYGGENALKVEEYCRNIEAHGLILKKILNHFESPINYFPMTSLEREKKINDFKSKSKWKWIPKFLIDGFPFLQNKFMNSFHVFNYFPGMHCSFVAVKR